ncbi:hypothetical protein ACMATS_06395 [Streptoverticillium reticulum]|uniref:hypothetical protein n=1 Tax=Streptoverticillium reticulum TaxID=1433415 RepID=UPI0039BF7DA2
MTTTNAQLADPAYWEGKAATARAAAEGLDAFAIMVEASPELAAALKAAAHYIDDRDLPTYAPHEIRNLAADARSDARLWQRCADRTRAGQPVWKAI